MLALLLASGLALAGAYGAAAGGLSPWALARHDPVVTPGVELWTDAGDLLLSGESVRVYFRTDEDAYITLLRVDTDGRIEVLFPRNPWEDNYARGRRRYEVRSPGHGHAFVVDEYPGQGYLFAVASADPFDYREMVWRDRWDFRSVTHEGRVAGDPYVAVNDIVEAILPYGEARYSWDVVSYDVERRVEYPRFLCYDCHAYAPYPVWDPYLHSCIRFRIVIYDDPYYYPARVYGGTRVVYRRPVHNEPRFVFKDRDPRAPYVTRTRERTVERDRRPAVSEQARRGVTARDLGGVGRVPAPRLAPSDRPDLRIPDRPELRQPDSRGGERPQVGGEVRRSPGTPTERAAPTLERRVPRSERSGQGVERPRSAGSKSGSAGGKAQAPAARRAGSKGESPAAAKRGGSKPAAKPKKGGSGSRRKGGGS